jgi:hypothetical protein
VCIWWMSSVRFKYKPGYKPSDLSALITLSLNFEFHAGVQKCHFGNFSILPKPVHKIPIFFGQKTSFEALRKCHLQKIFITFSRVSQIQDLGQSKYKLRLFSKRTHWISKTLFNLGSFEFLAKLESKIRKCLFFDGSLL